MGAIMCENHGKLLGLYDELAMFFSQINVFWLRGLSDSHEMSVFLQLYGARSWIRKTGIFIYSMPVVMVNLYAPVCTSAIINYFVSFFLSVWRCYATDRNDTGRIRSTECSSYTNWAAIQCWNGPMSKDSPKANYCPIWPTTAGGQWFHLSYWSDPVNQHLHQVTYQDSLSHYAESDVLWIHV